VTSVEGACKLSVLLSGLFDCRFIHLRIRKHLSSLARVPSHSCVEGGRTTASAMLKRKDWQLFQGQDGSGSDSESTSDGRCLLLGVVH
jgi:hypothetical protein